MKNLYNRILDIITDNDIKEIIKGAINICKNIFIILIIILLCFIFVPSFEWGWLDRNTMISSISTLIGGGFGLIAGIIGIMATYGAFYLGVRKEKEKEFNHKKEMLFNLLDHTITKTHGLYNKLDEFYNTSIKCALKEGVDLESKLSKYVKVRNDKIYLDIDEDAKYIFEAKDYKEPEILQLINGLDVYFNENILRSENLSILVYDDNWPSYLECLKELRKYGANRDMQRIINWITFLKECRSDNSYSSLDFMMMRRGIRCTISELNKEIEKEGFRDMLNYN